MSRSIRPGQVRYTPVLGELVGGHHICVTVTYKVDTDSGDVALGVSVVSKTKKKAGLSDTTVADQKKLEEVIAKGMQ